MDFDIAKTCENCQFYSQHYEIVSGKSLRAVNNGTCKNSENPNDFKQPETPACEKWLENKDAYFLTSRLAYASVVSRINELAMIVNKYEEQDKLNTKNTLD